MFIQISLRIGHLMIDLYDIIYVQRYNLNKFLIKNQFNTKLNII